MQDTSRMEFYRSCKLYILGSSVKNTYVLGKTVYDKCCTVYYSLFFSVVVRLPSRYSTN